MRLSTKSGLLFLAVLTFALCLFSSCASKKGTVEKTRTEQSDTPQEEIVEEEEEIPNIPKCYNAFDLGEWDGLRKIVAEIDARRVTKYQFRDGWAYLLQCDKGAQLYDCQGNFLCNTASAEKQECLDRINKLLGGRIIWVREGK